jgi:hypothetical protein
VAEAGPAPEAAADADAVTEEAPVGLDVDAEGADDVAAAAGVADDGVGEGSAVVAATGLWPVRVAGACPAASWPATSDTTAMAAITVPARAPRVAHGRRAMEGMEVLRNGWLMSWVWCRDRTGHGPAALQEQRSSVPARRPADSRGGSAAHEEQSGESASGVRTGR